jgi:HAE1 family hydrophobic/amphiphilic exporter-1
MVALLLLGGVFSVLKLNQELFPSIDIPYIIVSAIEPGAGPNAVAADLATPMSGAIASTPGLRHVQSTSLEGMAIVSAQYDFGTNMDETETAVREALASVPLPPGVAPPRVQRISPNSFPIYSVAVSGQDQAQLQAYVQGTLEPAISTADGVENVTTSGGSVQVVSVVLDPAKMAALGVSAGDVTAALQAANVSVPVGGVAVDGTQLPVRVASEVTDLPQVRAIPVPPSAPAAAAPVSAAPVATTLGDLGTVALTEGGTGSTISRVDGKPAIILDVVKSQPANTVQTVDAIEAAIAKAGTPSGIALSTIVDQAPEIKGAVSDLARDALLGAVLAILVILLFLRSFRGTLVTGVSIPMSLLVAFILMRMDHITLNILTLGALSVAAGRVIDDAIVVLENIHRLLDEGLERTAAVLKGTSQVVRPITASTITTVSVFLPLAMVGGLVGQVFVGFALTVTFALAASLFVAVTVVPVLAQTFLKERPRHRHDAGEAEERILKRMYRRPLIFVLSHRGVTVISAIVLLFLSMACLAKIPTTLFPSGEVTALSLSLTAAPGTSLQAMSEKVGVVESGIGKLPGVSRYSAVVGTSMDPLAALGGGGGGMSGSNSAAVTVDLAEGADADSLSTQLEALAAKAEMMGAVSPVGGDSGPDSTSLSVQVSGDDFPAVTAATAQVAKAVQAVAGVKDVTSNIAMERPELVVNVRPAEASALGLNTSSVAALVRTATTPTPATTMVIKGVPHQVIVAVDPAAVHGPEALAALPLGPGVVLGDVASIDQGSSPTAVTTYDGQRSAEVSGVITSDNVGLVNQDVKVAIDKLTLPPGVETSLGGAAELMSDSFSSLGVAMLIAIALVYLVMVSTFGSLLTPFVILLSLPLAMIGAFPALLMTGRELGLPAMLGLLMLIGIVVTNAIVMLEFVERLRREEGLSVHDALVQGASTRLRPILMTATVTILALTPLALGFSQGALLSASLATVVIGGLFSSTALTLFVIPAVYSLFDGLRRWATRSRIAEPDVATDG